MTTDAGDRPEPQNTPTQGTPAQDARDPTFTLTHDSHGVLLGRPVTFTLKNDQSSIKLMSSENGTERISIHLEMDALKQGELMLRAWDATEPHGSPYIMEGLLYDPADMPEED